MKERPTAGIYVFGQELNNTEPLQPKRAEVITTELGDKKIRSLSQPPPTPPTQPASDNSPAACSPPPRDIC